MWKTCSIILIFGFLNILVLGCGGGGGGGGGGTTVADLEITTTSLSEGTQDEYYIGLVEVTGGKTPYTWSLADGALPAGISLTSSTGSIEGTPLESGEFFFDVQVEDNSSTPKDDMKRLLITISPTVASKFGEQTFGTAVFE